MSDHKHGEMDITEHEKTYEGFIKVGVWGAVITILILVFLVIVAV